jgi:hypothetical protein
MHHVSCCAVGLVEMAPLEECDRVVIEDPGRVGAAGRSGIRWTAHSTWNAKTDEIKAPTEQMGNSCGNGFGRNLLCAFLRSGRVHHPTTRSPPITAPRRP